MSLIDQLRALRAAEMLPPVAAQSIDPFIGGTIGPDLTQVAMLGAEVRALIEAASNGELLNAYVSSAVNGDAGQLEAIADELKRRGISPPPY